MLVFNYTTRRGFNHDCGGSGRGWTVKLDWVCKAVLAAAEEEQADWICSSI